jgi:cell wall assembly regulator SMI1
MRLIIEVVAELLKFSADVLAVFPPVEEKDLQQFEIEHGLELPLDYKTLLQVTDGFSLMGTEVYGIARQGKMSLAQVYQIEHHEVAVAQYTHLVPFNNDGRGNFYCFDTTALTQDGFSCAIVFWVSNYQYSPDDQPEKTHDSFTNWMQECVIEWTLEDYDYSGNLLST